MIHESHLYLSGSINNAIQANGDYVQNYNFSKMNSMKEITITLITLLTIFSSVKGQPETIWALYQDGSIIRWAYSGGDEFNGTQLDNSKWNECFDFGCDYNPNSYFIKGSSHHILDNGILKLATKYEPGNYEIWHWDANGNFYTTQEHRNYTSGMIVAKQKFKYGLFEIRFKLPVGKGLWPAFWLFGGTPNQEFDIFEYKGETPNKVHIDMHCPDKACDKFGDWIAANGNFSDSFNDMMGEWGPNASFWYLNGKSFAIWLGNLNTQLYLVANAAVADNCPSPFCPGPDNTTQLPAYFEIDFIRVWTRLDCEQVITLSNYNQSATDPTVITGKTINASTLTLTPEQTLKLIAINEIVIDQHTTIEGEFEAKIVECSGPQKKEDDFFNQSDSAIKISSIEPDSINDNNKQTSPNIENPSLLYTKIYPNPTKGEISIEFDGKIVQNMKIEVINSHGQIVFSKNVIEEKSLKIDISHLPKGIYFLKGTFGNKSISDKIILN